MDPFLVLNVDVAATDQQVRQAYLAALKTASPEHHPVRFRAINSAYNSIQHERERLEYQLFGHKEEAHLPEEILDQAVQVLPPPNPLSWAKLKVWIQDSNR